MMVRVFDAGGILVLIFLEKEADICLSLRRDAESNHFIQQFRDSLWYLFRLRNYADIIVHDSTELKRLYRLYVTDMQ